VIVGDKKFDVASYVIVGEGGDWKHSSLENVFSHPYNFVQK
jgi:hypothetical protein